MTHKRFLLAFAAAVPAALALAYGVLGGPGILAIGVIATLALAAHFDNHTGSCLLITIIFLVVIGILLSLLMATVKIVGH